MVIFKKATENDKKLIYQHGFDYWGGNRTWKEYVEENKREEEHGERFILIQDDVIVSSIIAFQFNIKGEKVIGLGSLITEPSKRGNHYGLQLLTKCLEYFYPIPIIGYSDIDYRVYEKLGFRKFPKHLQRYSKSPLIVNCQDEQLKKMIHYSLDDYPTYF